VAHTRTGHGVPALLGLLTGLALLGCGGSSAPTATPTSASSASAPATSAPATASATPSPSAAATPTAAAISLSCPSASDVSTDFQTPFTALPPGAGDALVVNGEPPPGGASVSQCTYTDSAISASVVILLATGYPAADFATAEQDITHNTVGGTVTGSETFDPQSGLGDQAVAYDFTLSTSSGTNYEFGTIAIQGTNLVSVLGYGTTFTPDQQMFNTLIEALLA
jgi:hypothetical protein